MQLNLHSTSLALPFSSPTRTTKRLDAGGLLFRRQQIKPLHAPTNSLRR
jgi:hypothetical protein